MCVSCEGGGGMKKVCSLFILSQSTNLCSQGTKAAALAMNSNEGGAVVDSFLGQGEDLTCLPYGSECDPDGRSKCCSGLCLKIKRWDYNVYCVDNPSP